MDVTNMVNVGCFPPTVGSVPVIVVGQGRDVMLPWRWSVMTWRIMIEVCLMCKSYSVKTLLVRHISHILGGGMGLGNQIYDIFRVTQ